MRTIKIVVSRYNEDIEWANKFDNVIIYNKGEPLHTHHRVINLPNLGREGHTIFHHIYENYHKLDEYTLFLQGSPFDHSPNLIRNLEKYINGCSSPEFEYLSERFYNTFVFDCPHHSCLPMRIVYNKVFNCNIIENKEIMFGAGSQFVVSKKRILKRPREFYKNIIEILEYSVKPVEGWVIERLHNEIFNNDEVRREPIPIVIICYNNYKYVKNMIEQLINLNPDYKSGIIVMNNTSDDALTIEYLKSIENEFQIKTLPNNGPWVTPTDNADFFNELPNKFILTDPDLEFHPDLPNNFVDKLSILSDKYKASKIGFAINITDTTKMYPGEHIKGVIEWEIKFWKTRIQHEQYELYIADIDTTFSLINKKNWLNPSIRIAGNFTCRHLPFYIDNGIMSIDEEYEYYTKSKFSTMSKIFLSYYNGVCKDQEQEQKSIQNKNTIQAFLT